ncbi:hypothetical protein MSSAC_2652 [Methanosarcina siciliae C2J]|uniref:Uncharacterized protein n=2 Tax=Methanosarcina siciliae TaxID=38027 RepID=A0A0E3L8Q1_9EURY|nr:hypothetical protein [Methanosarcina siciliae]AKB28911.1 hypothetical protein MSSIT_2192 [Methanosarcina siciliae T4/M]AKB37242.1 hypothetical protein MSSAC_2652 [Methanosarcina siciliae C2J]
MLDWLKNTKNKMPVADPAPIDCIVLAIWLKRLLLVNSPNLIFRVISPFIKVVSGTLLEMVDPGSAGN